MVNLMAPGGTKQMAIDALECGADSVFIGPKGWSRRPVSDELSDLEMKEVIQFAGNTGKEARIAINVMPCPDEIPLFLHKVEQYFAWGAAGVMICDPGCIHLVREHFPDVDIHVSVTAGLFNIEDIHFYRSMGANLVIIPYRWGVAEIEQVRNKVDVGLEAFLFQTPHRGWICPGRCWSSSYLNIDRWVDEEGKDHCIGSASRGGSCHRICQGEWRRWKADEPTPFTPRLKGSPELLLSEIPAYIELGATCFKLPGRERSTRLVCELVRFYRRVLDYVLAGHSEVDAFVPEWEALRQWWVEERVSRDNGRLHHANAMLREPENRVLNC